MRPLRRLLCAAILSGLVPVAGASPDAPRIGIEYRVLPTPQNTDAGSGAMRGAVEVTEFFAYYCPVCNGFEPRLAEWVKKQGDNIVFKRVHVSHGAAVLPQQRLFYTLEAMGLLDQYHDKVFAAMHVERQRLSSDELVFDWARKAGIDGGRFIDTYRSFGVQSRLRRAHALMQGHGIDHWPMIAIDGRYVTSMALANDSVAGQRTEAEYHKATLQVMDHLVAKAKADKK